MESNESSSQSSNVLDPLKELEGDVLKEFAAEFHSWQTTLRSSRSKEAEHVERCKILIQEKENLDTQTENILERANRKSLELQSCQERTSEMLAKCEKIKENIVTKKETFRTLTKKEDLLQIKTENLDNALKEENEKKEREMYQKVEKLAASREVFQSKVNRMWGENLELQQALQALQLQKAEEQKKD